MAKRIALNKTELVEVKGRNLMLEVTEDEQGRLLARVESELGGRRIKIKQHEEDARCIVFYLEEATGSHLSIVK